MRGGLRSGIGALLAGPLVTMIVLLPGASARPLHARHASPATNTGRARSSKLDTPSVPTLIAFVTSSEAQPESKVWTTLPDGAGRTLLGPGQQPLLSPNGALVAAGLFGTGAGSSENGPSLVLYSTGGSPALTRGNLAAATATPLAWSPDSRYLAVALMSTAVRNVARGSGLAILDTSTGTLKKIAGGIVSGASFAPGGSDRVVFSRSDSQRLQAPVNLYVSAPSGAGLKRITSDGRSLNPVWGPRFIAYDRERLRRQDAPVYEIWLRRSSGAAPRKLTAIRVRSLVSGLVPLGFSASGARLLAEFEGQDTSEAWTVRVPSGRARPVRVGRRSLVAGAISRDGSQLLLAEGGAEGPASQQNIITVPFGGGTAKLLVSHAAEPSWND